MPKPVKSTSFDKNVSLKQFDRCNTEEETGSEPEKSETASLLKAKSLPAILQFTNIQKYILDSLCPLLMLRQVEFGNLAMGNILAPATPITAERPVRRPKVDSVTTCNGSPLVADQWDENTHFWVL